MLDTAKSWGPAHELGHALIEPPHRWKKRDYGRCAIGFCRRHRSEECDVYEAAAMRISAALVRAAGHPELSDKEAEDTPDYDLITEESWRRGKALLKRKKLWPIPRTRKSLEAALKRRLGKPRGRHRLPSTNPPPPSPPLNAFQMLVNEILGPR